MRSKLNPLKVTLETLSTIINILVRVNSLRAIKETERSLNTSLSFKWFPLIMINFLFSLVCVHLNQLLALIDCRSYLNSLIGLTSVTVLRLLLIHCRNKLVWRAFRFFFLFCWANPTNTQHGIRTSLFTANWQDEQLKYINLIKQIGARW